MIKVLILAHSFPEEISAGAQRPYSWYRYLKSKGVYPIVITRDWSNKQNRKDVESELGKIIRVPVEATLRDRLLSKYGHDRYILLRKILSFWQWVMAFMFSRFDPLTCLHERADEFLRHNNVDCMIATGEPFILFKYCHKLSTKFKIPWVADYRDGWSTNSWVHYARFYEKFLMRYFFRPLEKKYIKSAETITTVSKPLKEELKHLHTDKDVHLLLNGFDKENFKGLSDKQSGSEMIIAYAGSILPYQRLDIFMQGYEKFVDECKPKCKLIFYGLEELLCVGKYPHEYVSRKVADSIEYTKAIPHSEVLKYLKRANMLLILSNEKVDGSCSKLFEYLAVDRRIIVSVNDSGTVEEIIKDTNSGMLCNNSIDVFEELKSSYMEWQKSKEVKSSTRNIDKYSREVQAERLAELLTTIVA